MKSLSILLCLVSLSFASTAYAGKCTGSAACTACTTCSSCGYCAKGGGSCGVCAKKKRTDAGNEVAAKTNTAEAGKDTCCEEKEKTKAETPVS